MSISSFQMPASAGGDSSPAVDFHAKAPQAAKPGRYQPYPEYQDSGVEWLGNIPNHWKLTFLKRYLTVMSGDMLSSSEIGDEGFPVVGGNGVRGYTKFNNTGENTIVIGRVGANCGCIHYLNEKFWATEHAFRVIKRKSFDDAFMCYYLDALSLNRFAITTAQPLLNTEIVCSQPISIPPDEDEQRSIAAFLDHETAKIDRLIAKQQRLIELLKEKRQAVISQAVTKGLNPGAPMKDSGVEWLGQVPEHWEVTRLKHECSNIVDCLHSTPEYDEAGSYPAIRTADISAGRLNILESRRVTKQVCIERNVRLTPIPRDIIYSREGERYGLAACIPLGAEVCLGQRVMLFRPIRSPEFVMWALNSNSCYKQAQQDVIGSTSPHVNVETIKNFALAWPPEDERDSIADFISSTCNKLDQLMVIAESKMVLLQERRTALISAAVTGKIDLRGWRPPADSAA